MSLPEQSCQIEIFSFWGFYLFAILWESVYEILARELVKGIHDNGGFLFGRYQSCDFLIYNQSP